MPFFNSFSLFMKKIIFTTLLLLCACLAAWAQVPQDCGAIDCPGRCGRFIDENGDGFCDRGRLSNTSTATVEEVAISEKSEPKATQPAKSAPERANTTKPTAEEAPIEPTATPGAPEEEIKPTDNEIVPESVESEEPVKTKKPYDLILISAITLGLYALTSILVKANVLKKTTHRKIWNILLLITALVSCLLGFFLVLQINYGWKMEWLWTVKYYHVEFGIAMTIVVLFHIFWHMNYWKTLFKKNKSKE